MRIQYYYYGQLFHETTVPLSCNRNSFGAFEEYLKARENEVKLRVTADRKKIEPYLTKWKKGRIEVFVVFESKANWYIENMDYE